MAQKLTPPNLHATLLAHVTYESSVRASRIRQVYDGVGRKRGERDRQSRGSEATCRNPKVSQVELILVDRCVFGRFFGLVAS